MAHGRMHIRMDAQVDKQMHGQKDACTHAHKDTRMHTQTVGWTNGLWGPCTQCPLHALKRFALSDLHAWHQYDATCPQSGPQSGPHTLFY